MMLLGATVLAALLTVAAAYTGAVASAILAKNLRQAIFTQIQAFSFREIDIFSPASLITRMTTDVNSIQNAFSMLIRMAVRAPASLIISIAISLFINVRLSLIFLAVTPIILIGMYFIITRAHPLFKKLFTVYDKLNLIVEENLRGIRVVKTFVREKYEIKKFHRVSDEIYRVFSHAEKILSFTSPLMELTMYTGILLVCWYGAQMIVAHQFTIGEMMSLISYFTQILMSLMMISMMMVMLVQSKAAIDRVHAVLQQVVSLTNPKQPITKVCDGSIEFVNVGFSYVNQKDKESLRRLNFYIPSGQTVGIIGSTGSGKSSLVNLIPRLYDATEGTVKVGNVDVRQYDLTTLRDSVSMVLQKNVLFSGTIKDNLRWGNANATDKQLIAACRQAQIHDFITSLPNGYDTKVEQGGTNFSGGQKQRLCIARTLLKQPKVLILDDSTSAVDTHTESLIRQAWKQQIPGTTIIIIAQRILSVMDADQIIVMDAGRISDIGTHSQLLKRNKIYREVYQSQSQKET